MKYKIIKIDYLEKVLAHIEARNTSRLINDLKTGGCYFKFFQAIHQAIENELELPAEEIAAFCDFVFDSPLYDKSKIDLMLSRYTSIEEIDFEISEKLINETISNAFQMEEPEEYLIDFILERIYLLFWYFTTFDNSIRGVQHKINRWIKNKPFDQDYIAKSAEKSDDKFDYSQFDKLKLESTEIEPDHPMNPSRLRIKKEELKVEYIEILQTFLNSIENESQRNDGRPCMENQQLLIDVLMFEKTNEIIRFNLDVNVILKFLNQISGFYEKQSIQNMLNENQFSSNKNNVITAATYSKNKSRASSTLKFKESFIKLEKNLIDFKRIMPNF